MKQLDWYFDFISPYSYLQSEILDRIAAHAEIRMRPVLFAGLLEYWGHVGPAELAPKRLWTFEHCVWLAQRHGIAFKLPAMHPFNPLPLLRLSIVLGNRRDAVARLFRFVWQEGRTTAESDAWKTLLAELDIDEDALRSDAVKGALRDNGAAAIAAGVFGVPTAVVEGRAFWGFEATDMLLDYLAGNTLFDSAAMRGAATMPAGPGRRSAPAAPPA